MTVVTGKQDKWEIEIPYFADIISESSPAL